MCNLTITSFLSSVLCKGVRTLLNHVIESIFLYNLLLYLYFQLPYSQSIHGFRLYEVLLNCSPDKQRLIYNIAQIVSSAKFV